MRNIGQTEPTMVKDLDDKDNYYRENKKNPLTTFQQLRITFTILSLYCETKVSIL